MDQSIDPECPQSNATVPCLNGGSCWDKKCCCPAKFTGKHCEISAIRALTCSDDKTCTKQSDPCNNSSTSICSNKGICIPFTNNTGYLCSCFDGLLTSLRETFYKDF